MQILDILRSKGVQQEEKRDVKIILNQRQSKIIELPSQFIELNSIILLITNMEIRDSVLNVNGMINIEEASGSIKTNKREVYFKTKWDT